MGQKKDGCPHQKPFPGKAYPGVWDMGTFLCPYFFFFFLDVIITYWTSAIPHPKGVMG